MKSITVAVLAISLSILAGLSTNADPLESETQTAMGLTFGQTFQQAQAA